MVSRTAMTSLLDRPSFQIERAIELCSSGPRRVSPETLLRAVSRSARNGLPKHIQLGNAIIDLINGSTLTAGDQIPPEQQLSQVLGLSLGTVQKTLNRLAIEGWVVREHGRGTFVADPNRATQDVTFYRYLDHFRFLDPQSGEPLPVHSTLISRDLAPSRDPVSKSLGADLKGFVRIIRRIDAGDAFSCRSSMYLAATRFQRLLTFPPHAFENVNLKQIFESQFNAPTTGLVQTVRVESVKSKDAKLLKIKPESCVLVLEILARTHGEQPLSLQRVVIPPSGYSLDVSQPSVAETGG
ncbi:MAG: GntR family transcriptional regulator [Verrucomicrobia bacterium]|nr:GntR family transcriptional regulator [Verrucomicrobiota bacterium]